MVKGDAVADTLFLYMRLFAPEEINGLYAYGPIWKDDLPTVLQGSYHMVSIDAEPECKMGFIRDLQEDVWQQGIWRVRYTCVGSGNHACQMLPGTRGAADLTEGYQGVTDENARPYTPFKLQINSRGMFRFNGKDVDASSLGKAVTTIIREQPTRYLIDIQTDRATPYESFVSAQTIVEQSLKSLRDEYAKTRFGKPFDEGLTEEQFIETVNAFPKRVI